MAQKQAEVLEKAKAAGWDIRRTKGGHLKLEHPQASSPVITSSTPSDHRTGLNLAAQLKRSLPPAGPDAAKIKSVGAKKKPKAKSPSPNFSMTPRVFAEEAPPVIDVTEAWWTALPEGAVRRAWSLALLRLRVEGKGWDVVKAIKQRVRTDNAFCGEMVQFWLDTPQSKIAEFRATLREGFKAEPLAPSYRPPGPPKQTKTPASPPVPAAPEAGPATFAMLAMERLRADLAEAKVRRLEEMLLQARSEGQAPPPPPPPPAPSKKKALMQERTRRIKAEEARDEAVAALGEERKLRQGLEERMRDELSKPKSIAPPPPPQPAEDSGGEDGLAERLAVRRQLLNLTQAELGQRVGVSAPCLSHWETGLRRPKPNRIDALARALNCPVTWLASGRA